MRKFVSFIIDFFLVAIATAVAFALRENFDFSWAKMSAFATYFGFTLATAAVVIPLLGLNRSVWRYSSMTDYLYLLAASVLITFGAVAASFVATRMDGVARSIPILQPVLILVFLAGARVFMRLRHAGRQKSVKQLSQEVQDLHRPSVVILGMTRLTELYLQSAHELNPGQVHVAGLIGRDERHTGRLMHRYPVLGVPDQIPEILKRLEVHGVFVDRILVTARRDSLGEDVLALLRNLESTSTVRVEWLAEAMGFEETRVAFDSARDAVPETSPSETSPIPRADVSLNSEEAVVLTIDVAEREKLQHNRYWSLKRGLDLLGSSLLIVGLLPVIGLVALLVLIDVGRPILFWQQRPGLGGRPFRLYKLRTMGSAFDEEGRKIPDEQRFTAIGRFLRRTRLDELPQLFHILKGEMSFVGPRPLLPVDQPVGYAARLLVRPGLTGWAQVRGGRHLTAVDKAALDVWYVRNASLKLDIEIVLRTVVMVLFGERVSAEALRRAWTEGPFSQTEGTTVEGLVEAPVRGRRAA
jgi:lipopolysaccharide/colanic/teichoic acid biosynthesis glycosyltransferase